MTGTGEVLHRGTKVFWKVRSTCDVVLIKHAAFDLVEVVCYDPVRSREAARLYVKQSVVRDRISEKQFLLNQKFAAEHKEQPEGSGSISSGAEISTIETVQYICDRLHVQTYDPKSRIFQIELVEYLPTEEKPAESEQMVYRKPASLIPFDIMHMPSKVPTAHPVQRLEPHSNTNTNTVPNKEQIEHKEHKEHKDLTVDIPAASSVEGQSPKAAHTPKTPKTPVPVIQLSLIKQDEENDHTDVTAPNTISTSNNNNMSHHTIDTSQHQNTLTHTSAENTTPPLSAQAQIALAQGLVRPVTAHTADSIEADFQIHHGRRAQNHRPFTANAHTTATNTHNTDANHTHTHTGTGSSLTSPVVSPRPQAGTAYAKQITPRKGGHISVLQATHNTHNSQAAEARHAKQHIHTNHSIVSHYSVGSSHLAPIPVPDQLTKVTIHPTLPPHRNLTPHQEPFIPTNVPPRYGKKKPNNTISASIASFTKAMYSLFGSSSEVRVAVDNSHSGDIHILDSHNVVQHVKPGTISNYTYASGNSINSSSSAGSGAASIPKHMRTNV